MIFQKTVTPEGTKADYTSIWMLKNGFVNVAIKVYMPHTDTLGDFRREGITAAVKKMVAELNEEKP